jgi:hypothetical protein
MFAAVPESFRGASVATFLGSELVFVLPLVCYDRPLGQINILIPRLAPKPTAALRAAAGLGAYPKEPTARHPNVATAKRAYVSYAWALSPW